MLRICMPKRNGRKKKTPRTPTARSRAFTLVSTLVIVLLAVRSVRGHLRTGRKEFIFEKNAEGQTKYSVLYLNLNRLIVKIC